MMSTRYTEEFRDRAVRLLAESREYYTSETQALAGVAKDLGVAVESLRRWQEGSDVVVRRAPRSPLSSGSCAGRTLSCEGRTMSCRVRRLCSPQGSTRHGIDDRVYRLASRQVRGRADLPNVETHVAGGFITARAYWQAKARAVCRMRARP